MATDLVLEQAEVLSSKWTEDDENPYVTQSGHQWLWLRKKEEYKSGKKHG